MNKAVLIGRLGKDPELRTSQGGTEVVSFSVAVDRRYKSDGERKADWISCVAFRKTAEFISKYFVKGSKIGIVGTIQTRNYDDANGVKRYVTEVVVDEAEFVTSKAQNAGAAQAPPVQQNADELFADEDFQPMDEAELPFE